VKWTARLRLIQIACIVALLECFRFSRSVRHEWNGKLTLVHWLLIVGAVWSGISGFTLQRRIVNGPKRRSTSTPITRWRAGHIARLSTATAVGLYGFCLGVFAGPPLVVNALFALGVLLLLVWTPGTVPDQAA
jgi:hypothetical protein